MAKFNPENERVKREYLIYLKGIWLAPSVQRWRYAVGSAAAEEH